jgi:hypothetical protein
LLAILDLLEPDLVPIPPNLVPGFLGGLQDDFVVAPQEERPFLARILLLRNPFYFVAVLGVADSVAIRAQRSRFDGVGGLGFRPSPLKAGGGLPHEVAVELLNFGH